MAGALIGAAVNVYVGAKVIKKAKTIKSNKKEVSNNGKKKKR